MATEGLAKLVVKMSWWLLHLPLLGVSFLVGLTVYWAAHSVVSPAGGDLEGIQYRIQDALRTGYIAYLRTELSSIRLPEDFNSRVSSALTTQEGIKQIQVSDMTFMPFNGKELIFDNGARSALEEFYEGTLRGSMNVRVCEEGAASMPSDRAAVARALAEQTIMAAKTDAERTLQCGIAVVDDRQPRECWLKQLNKPENPTARVQALRAVVGSGIEEGEYASIVGLLGDTNQNIRKEAADILVKSGRQAVVPLVDELKRNPMDDLRAGILSVLVKIGVEAQDKSEIIKALQSQKDEGIRSEVEGVIKGIQETGKQSPPESPSRPDRSSAPQPRP